jgi:hypothetical protein
LIPARSLLCALIALPLLAACVPRPLTPRPSPTAERRGDRGTIIESVVKASTPTSASRTSPAEPSVTGSRPIAVIIENAPEARPQSGLSQADVVVEAMAEGGISRFMAVFASQSPGVVGPVRSARHYFVNLAAELGAPLVHFGSSPQGYEAIAAIGLPTVDGIVGEGAFTRDRRRAAPHNAYTSVEQARAAVDGNWPRSRVDSLTPARDSVGAWTAIRSARSIQMAFKPWSYRAGFEFDDATRSYARYSDGEAQHDADGAALAAASVILLTVPAPIIDSAGRLDIVLRGEGELKIAANGTVEEGHWQKRTATDPLRLISASGAVLSPPRGPVWIEIVQPETVVEIQ